MSTQQDAPLDEQALLARLSGLGITVTHHRHPPLFTVEDSQTLRGDIPGAHTKNLFLKDKKGRIYLVTTLEDRPIRMKALERLIGSARLSFGKPELLEEVLGVKPGSVTPLAVVNDREGLVDLVLDADLLAQGTVNVHPLHNEATLTMSADDLVRFVAENGHAPHIMSLKDAETD
ncbi:prolyl-tRNA synthetase associated domain-containing protein [Futiania mangrovi]|uniref:Prolyl-tRNA synthetase associated domain-containing protein n=1 Tax=Futiania mangrovi TaxID=2959716 RepID=A0A9J6PJ24_9PROT|nr:prolyl-tRNA synthetase associated domain-containing protein [Futiania mangrovii]MCP1336551.1 prolyl-tRNA synthetase associated domain-containing protein [Futiania mangrovii]